MKFSKFCFESFHRDTDGRIVFKFSWNLADGKSVKSCVAYLTKIKWNFAWLFSCRYCADRVQNLPGPAPSSVLKTQECSWTSPTRAVKWIQYSAEAFKPNKDAWGLTVFCSKFFILQCQSSSIIITIASSKTTARGAANSLDRRNDASFLLSCWMSETRCRQWHSSFPWRDEQIAFVDVSFCVDLINVELTSAAGVACSRLFTYFITVPSPSYAEMCLTKHLQNLRENVLYCRHTS